MHKGCVSSAPKQLYGTSLKGHRAGPLLHNNQNFESCAVTGRMRIYAIRYIAAARCPTNLCAPLLHVAPVSSPPSRRPTPPFSTPLCLTGRLHTAAARRPTNLRAPLLAHRSSQQAPAWAPQAPLEEHRLQGALVCGSNGRKVGARQAHGQGGQGCRVAHLQDSMPAHTTLPVNSSGCLFCSPE